MDKKQIIPTYLDLPNDISGCHRLIVQQADQIALLESKLADLEAKFNKNSRNSSKPPSSDGLKKQVAKSGMPKKKGKTQGGQKGHKGKTLEMSNNPDRQVDLFPEQCSCGHVFTREELQSAILQESRQVFDVPEPKLEVIEYRQMRCGCGKCGQPTLGVFPDRVNASVQYGFGVRSMAVLLNVGYHLPVKKIGQLFGDLFGYTINEATVCDAKDRFYQALESSEGLIKQQIEGQEVAHLDETGVRTAGRLHWLHVACNSLFTYLFVHPKRGKEAMQSNESVVGRLKNFIVHDCWSSYFNYKDTGHGLCGAHLLRELLGLQEQGVIWAKWFRYYLYAVYGMVEKQKEGVLDQAQQDKAEKLFDTIWQYADQIEPPPEKPPNKKGRPKATKGRNLLNRLKEHKHKVLAFAKYGQVPFTNNQAERDLRPFKTKLKVSGCFRTLKGAQIHARIFGFISTARKHQVNIFQELKNTLQGTNFIMQKFGE